MRAILTGPLVTLGVLGVLLGTCSSVRAGVYLTKEAAVLPPADLITPENVRFWVGEVRAAALPREPKPGSVHFTYLQEMARLEGLRAEDNLSTRDLVDLGGCYIRLGKYDQAVSVLRAGDRRNFLILANLAAAYHAKGELLQAAEYQQQALAEWPAVWAGWSDAQLRWNRRVERFYLTLLKHRLGEQRRGGGDPAEVPTVDDLFPPVQFVEPGGSYRAGTLPPRMADELPPDAFPIAVQLVLWTPHDNRLYWLLGEVLNARGNVDVAYSILYELYYAREKKRWTELVRHERILKQAVPALAAFRQRDVFLPLLAALTPQGAVVPPGAGAACAAAAAAAPIALASQPSEMSSPAAAAPPPAQPPPTAPGWVPDWRPLTVGFGAGILVALLASQQWHEWRRKRGAAPWWLRGGAGGPDAGAFRTGPR
jgi:tetratricopeptide (TPR) repeat protein